jgi:hypothetical protein
MNPLTRNPELALTMARRIIDDRVRDTEQRARARAVRAELRTARRPSTATEAAPRRRFRSALAAFRFLRPA